MYRLGKPLFQATSLPLYEEGTLVYLISNSPSQNGYIRAAVVDELKIQPIHHYRVIGRMKEEFWYLLFSSHPNYHCGFLNGAVSSEREICLRHMKCLQQAKVFH